MSGMMLVMIFYTTAGLLLLSGVFQHLYTRSYIVSIIPRNLGSGTYLGHDGRNVALQLLACI